MHTNGASPPEPRFPVGTRKSRIVIAEDDDDSRAIRAETLTILGYEVHQARDGVSACELADRVKPDVVIADLKIGGVDGFELARELRQRHGRTIRLIALTAVSHSWAQSMEAGYDYYLLKPALCEELVPYIEGDVEPLRSSLPAGRGAAS